MVSTQCRGDVRRIFSSQFTRPPKVLKVQFVERKDGVFGCLLMKTFVFALSQAATRRQRGPNARAGNFSSAFKGQPNCPPACLRLPYNNLACGRETFPNSGSHHLHHPSKQFDRERKILVFTASYGIEKMDTICLFHSIFPEPSCYGTRRLRQFVSHGITIWFNRSLLMSVLW